MALTNRTQRALLFGVITTVVVGGLVGTYCLIFGRLNWLLERVVLSTVALGIATILGLISAHVWERRRWYPLGMVATIADSLTLAYALLLIWWDDLHQDSYIRGFVIACTLAVAWSLTALLSLARLRGGYARVQFMTLFAIVLLAALIIMLVLEVEFAPEDIWIRAMGILAICVVCGTISVGVLHRVTAIREREAIRTFTPEIRLTCPRCASAQQVRIGYAKCSACGLKFHIQIEEDRCPRCGYLTYRLASAACPECGLSFEGTPNQRSTAPPDPDSA
jgi:hypothetical protein